MVLNLFKTLASKNEAAHHRTHQSSRNEPGRLGTTSGRISRMAGSLPQHVPEVLTPSGGSPAATRPSSSVGGVMMSRLHHPMTSSSGGGGSLSAPSSPASLKSSSNIPSLKMRHGIRPPAPNIIVEKGRIEFVKTAAVDAPSSTTTTTTTDKQSKLVMGTKIFRPPAPKKSDTEQQQQLQQTESTPPVKKWIAKDAGGGSISFRERSASPKFNTRESTPPLPDSKIPSARIKQQQSSSQQQQPDVLVNNRNIPRPGFINKSRETSPSPASAAKSIPTTSGSSSSSSTSCASVTTPPATTTSSSKSGASASIPVPVSPNLIRWRAKLSGSSGPCVTNHLNNVSAATTTTTSTSVSPTSPVAGSNKKTTTSQLKTVGSAAKSLDKTSGPAGTGTASRPSQVDPAAADSVPDNSSNNQMQLLNLHYEVKRLEETVQTLLPLRHQQSALIQSYEERLSEAQARLAAAEAEVVQLKERLSRCEGAEVDGRQVIQQLETDKASMAANHEQQRIVFDKCLDEIANHVVQALISQKNLQGECRRLRSQVSDLEQRNVALNLLLTQSLRDSMLENKKPGDGMVKSQSYDVTTTANPRDSLCSTVSDSEIRLNSSSSIFETASGVRPLVSKDSNWTLSSSSSSSSTSQAALAVQQSAETNPVERAEKLLAVLKHRLFSAQLNSYKSIRTQPRNNNEIRRSLVLPAQVDSSTLQALPARPSTLSFCPSAATSKEAANDPSTPSVRALVQVLEKRVANPLPVAEKAEKSPRPPLPLAPGLMRAIRNAAVVTGDNSDSPASKDEGYSTMSSDVQVDSSSSSSSSFIASGCSSPATLRRSASGSTPNSTTRSLPMAKRKTLLSSSSPASSSLSESRPQPNRSISLQETHSGAGLEELKEEASDETNDDQPSSGHFSDHVASAPSSFNNKREWPGVQLGTLCEDWSPSSVASDTESDRDGERAEDGAFARSNQDDQNLQKWTSDSELYKADQEDQEVTGEESWKTLESRSRNLEQDSQHPLRRSRAHVELSSEPSSASAAAVSASNRVQPNYSEHEMEDWILEHDPSPSESEEAGATALPAISENSYESDGDDEDEELFVPDIYSPVCDQETAEESEAEEEDPEESLDTEFTRDYYRLVKFESNRSLANSEKYDHCPPETAVETGAALGAGSMLPPPDRQVALQTVLDFIAEQQRYCAIRESADAANVTPELLDTKEPSSVSSLLQLRHLIEADDDSSREADSSEDEDDGPALHSGFSTNWLPVHGSRAELVDLSNAEIRASMLEKLFRSSSSSSSESGSCGSFEDNNGKLYRLKSNSQDSCPPSIASPSAAEESHC